MVHSPQQIACLDSFSFNKNPHPFCLWWKS